MVWLGVKVLVSVGCCVVGRGWRGIDWWVDWGENVEVKMVYVVVLRMFMVVVDGVGGDMEKVWGRWKKGYVLVD